MVRALIRNRGKGLSESGFKDRLIAKKRQNNGGRIAKPFFGETFLFCPLAESNKDGEEGIRKVSWSSGSLRERIPQEALSYFLGKLIPVIKRKPDTLSSPCPRKEGIRGQDSHGWARIVSARDGLYFRLGEVR